MENPPQVPLSGLDPAELLRQGVADDTLPPDGPAESFHPPTIEELAALFPRFEILELIGQGGMGAVYKVRQKDLDRVVALKILPPAISGTAGFSERFTLEAKALAKLNHPGIVTIHEFGSTFYSQPSTSNVQPLYFILMEFVDGVNLGQLMRAGRIAPREALAIVPQICDALQFAHDHGIVHRDIKPENILLDRHGRVKVADFGIAKVVAAVCETPFFDSATQPSPTDVTISGKIMGTPQYMAPEQIARPSEVDHRADIYALGVVFYQMLTGELPGKDLQAPSKKVSIDVRLDEIVMQALEKNPELRFQQASVFKTKIEEVQGIGENGTTAKWFGAVSRGKHLERRRSRLWAMVGIALILCLPLAVWAAFDQRSRQPVKHSEDYTFTIPTNTSTEDAREILTKALGSFQDVALSRLPDSRQWRLSSAGPSQKQVESRIREAVAAVRHDLTLNKKRVLSEPMVNQESRAVSSQIVPWNGDPGFLLKLRTHLVMGIICATLGFLCLLPPRSRRSNGWIATALVMWLGIAGVVLYQVRAVRLAGFDPWLTIDVPVTLGAGNAVSEPNKIAANGHQRMDAAVREWLGMIDDGNLNGAWNEMSQFAKSLQSESDWEAMLKASRKPLGGFVSRELATSGVASGLGGLRDLSSRTYQYRTHFEHGDRIEIVTLMLELSGDLRVMSYVVEPDDMSAAADGTSKKPITAEEVVSPEVGHHNLSIKDHFELRVVTPDDKNAKLFKFVHRDGTTQELRLADKALASDRDVVGVQMEESNGEPGLSLEFDKDCAGRLGAATAKPKGNLRLAILINGEVHSIPVVRAQLGRYVSINGFKTNAERAALFAALPLGFGETSAVATWWLEAMYAGNNRQTYQLASELVKKSWNLESWEKLMNSKRRAFGAVVFRSETSRKKAKELPGYPAGDFQIIEYQTEFATKTGALERVTLMKDTDDVWKVVGYDIK